MTAINLYTNDSKSIYDHTKVRFQATYLALRERDIEVLANPGCLINAVQTMQRDNI